MLIVVCGLPGTGKSTLAKALALELHAEYMNTDIIRKRIFPKPDYSLDEKRKVYEEMKAQAKQMLAQGKDVILDATFFKKEFRNMMRSIGAEIYFIRCTLAEGIVEKRLNERKEKRHDPSDADYKIYKEVKEEFEPIEGPFLEIDCTIVDKESIAKVKRFIEGK